MLPDHVGRHQSDREGSMDACPKCTHPHVVKAGEGSGQTALALSGLWLSVYVHHAAWAATVAKIASRLSLLSWRLDERLGEDVRGVGQHDPDLDSPVCCGAR